MWQAQPYTYKARVLFLKCALVETLGCSGLEGMAIHSYLHTKSFDNGALDPMPMALTLGFPGFAMCARACERVSLWERAVSLLQLSEDRPGPHF